MPLKTVSALYDKSIFQFASLKKKIQWGWKLTLTLANAELNSLSHNFQTLFRW